MDNSQQGLSAKIVDYIAARGQDKLEKLDKDIDKLKLSANPADQAKLEKLEQKRLDEREKFIPANWLTDAAKRAGQLQLVSHAPKFIHSDARATGVFALNSKADVDGTISTANIQRPAVDVIGNAAALDVGKLLQLEDEGKALIDYVAADDPSPLLPIAQNDEQATQWLAGFKRAICVDKVTSHKLAKQVYWPLDGGDDAQQYHLLAPLYATSLQHSIYETINSTRFSETAKAAKTARKEKILSDVGVINFVGIAEQHFGGTKPQNISQLNSQRYGKAYLMDASPPSWQTIAKPPLNVKTIFAGIFNHRAGKQGRALRHYLEHVFKQQSVKAIRDERADRIDQIVDILFAYVGEIHLFEPGWTASADCQLSDAEQLLLDPKRRDSDEKFELKWDKKDWPEEIAASLARWINRQLEGVKHKSELLAPGDVELVQWKVLIAQKLRVLKDDFREFYIDCDDKEHN
ncbi:MAG: type I-F CRISPR-associated protein Csy1 [Algicola sp.]|nr:type I-F CRISPR-associated protein Csy1 [Algicola sp.]